MDDYQRVIKEGGDDENKEDIKDKEDDSKDAQPADESRVFKANESYIMLYVLTFALNTVNVAWTTAGNNQMAPIFAAKFGWDAAETRLNNSLINLASQIGKAAGAILGGYLILNGRKRIFLVFSCLSIQAIMIQQILDMRAIVLGKLLHGICVTVVHIANVKMIQETVPAHLLGYYGVFIAVVMMSGYSLTCFVGLGLPSGDYNPALGLKNQQNYDSYEKDVKDSFWRFILFIPVIINVIMLSVFFLAIRADSIMFNLSKKDEEHDQEALKLIDKVYHKSEDR